MMPVRIQRKRTKGWKMPPNTVSVTRPGPWGNPYRVGDFLEINGRHVEIKTNLHARTLYRDNVAMFNLQIAQSGDGDGTKAARAWIARLSELRGKHLACFCKIGEPCHADVLLEIANATGKIGEVG